MAYSFGVGYMWGINTSTNPPGTPYAIRFGALQDVSIDFTFTTKELRSQKQFPLLIARGNGKIEGKAKVARLDINLFNQMFFDLAGYSGGTVGSQVIADESDTIPATTPFTITVATNPTGMSEDLGVYYTATGIPLTLVTTTPTTGQYSVSVSTGVYTFAAADAGLGVKISYRTANMTGRTGINLINPVMGVTPTFKITLANEYSGNNQTITFAKCTSSKLSLPMKLDDFLIPELDFTVMDDGTGNIGSVTVSPSATY